MRDRVTLFLPARLERRQEAECALRDLCQQHRLPALLCDELLTALNEAFNNVVLHAYRDQPGGEVEVTLQLDEAEAVIELADRGLGFDQSALPTHRPASDGRLAEGGYGLHIIRSLMTHVSYYQEGQRNVVRMTRTLPAADRGDPPRSR